ncbi:ParB N-terminal domain-containing protein [Beijerinckia indica]|uniref:ParB domain protein nuclease n=1 Tax=Beijerinckia indica subsp. indica (strain ATCC 9039 / DSM 1715 / NCIMB 8712) TaxID=395963 RepID=B2IL81_BEII9|nr:ParB N-terminal domain-containing protein [Beijerinckia indica]ACB97281.1 ParB domain protein nuclease [Beijerinckia indica subsp. indica ATCC 9039]
MTNMELREVDPRILKFDSDNPRRIAADECEDAQLIASIRIVGLLQPPIVYENDAGLFVKVGKRRTLCSIAADLATIKVLVTEKDDDLDAMRAYMENAVRAPMSLIDTWRAIEALAKNNWTEQAIAHGLAMTVRDVKCLRLLGQVHPPMLDHMGHGDMPKESELKVIALASLDDQASVWKAKKPKKGQQAFWNQIAAALQKTKFLATDARFSDEDARAFGLAWQDDLFGPADEDNRFTNDREAFLAAQQAWLEKNLPKNGMIVEMGDYGQMKLPPKAERIWTKPGKKDFIAFAIDQSSGRIHEQPYRMPAPVKNQNGKKAETHADDATPIPAKTKPDLTSKGWDMIGDFRTEALHKALAENPIDDTQLIGLLVLAFSAQNVDVKTGQPYGTFKTLVGPIIQGGHLTQDPETLRQTARTMLAHVLTCKTGWNSSGLPAQLAGDAIGADAHLPSMGSEDFLKCLSRPALEKAGSDLGVLPRDRVKDTRTAVLGQIGEAPYIHPLAHFALNDEQIAKITRPAETYDDETDPEAEGDVNGADAEMPEHEPAGMEDDAFGHAEDDYGEEAA